jgi:hypothetical protein
LPPAAPDQRHGGAPRQRQADRDRNGIRQKAAGKRLVNRSGQRSKLSPHAAKTGASRTQVKARKIFAALIGKLSTAIITSRCRARIRLCVNAVRSLSGLFDEPVRQFCNSVEYVLQVVVIAQLVWKN